MRCELVALNTFHQIAVQCWILLHAFRVQNRSCCDCNNALFIMQQAIVTQYTNIRAKVVHYDVNYAILSQVNLPDTIFSLQNNEIPRRPDTKHQVREDPRQMQQLSRRPWQSHAAHQGAAVPSLGTAAL